jgi:hypothetical protein
VSGPTHNLCINTFLKGIISGTWSQYGDKAEVIFVRLLANVEAVPKLLVMDRGYLTAAVETVLNARNFNYIGTTNHSTFTEHSLNNRDSAKKLPKDAFLVDSSYHGVDFVAARGDGVHHHAIRKATGPHITHMISRCPAWANVWCTGGSTVHPSSICNLFPAALEVTTSQGTPTWHNARRCVAFITYVVTTHNVRGKITSTSAISIVRILHAAKRLHTFRHVSQLHSIRFQAPMSLDEWYDVAPGQRKHHIHQLT